MEIESLLDLLTCQLQDAEAEFEDQRRRSEKTEGTSSLLRSLRVSIQTLSSGVPPVDWETTSFVLAFSKEGRAQLRRDRQVVPLSGSYLPILLSHVGIVLVSGECLVVETDFARRLVEESLGETACEQRRQERRRAELLTAYKQSSGAWRDEITKELGRLDQRDAEILIQKIELAELHGTSL